MAGEQKRKDRAVMVTKALLLGFTFEEGPSGKLVLRLPNGNLHMEWHHKGQNSYGPYTVQYAAQWIAAKAALEIVGVKHEKKSR